MTQKKKNRKPLIAAVVAVVAVLVVGSLIFKPTRWQHYLICAAVLALIGRVVYIMAQGVDTSKKAPTQKPIQATGKEKADAAVEKGLELLRDIREEDERIPDPELTGKISQLEDVTNRIVRAVADQPEKASQVRRFLNYYLPTTLKLLQGYRRMEERQVEGQNAEKTKQQVQEAMDMILKAFDRQLDAIYESDMLDVSTDIDVLETLLRQDGLVDTGLHGQEETEQKEPLRQQAAP